MAGLGSAGRLALVPARGVTLRLSVRPCDVTAPFVFACGTCDECRAGATQVCTCQEQPGFTLPGSFAEQVVVADRKSVV